MEMARLEAGEGGRPLLLVHGFTGAKEDFADWIDPLAARGWHVVAPDLRGHGGSPHPEPETDYSLATFAADVVDLVDGLGWDRFVLLGHSMGGMIAQLVAVSTVGARLDGLVLMDTSHTVPEGLDPDAIETGRQIVLDGGMELLAEILRKMEDGPLTSAADLRVRAERPGYAEWTEQKMLASSGAMWRAMTTEMLTQADRIEQLGSLDVPTLVIVGEQDAGFIAASERMAKTIPAARLAVIPDGGHSPQFEAPDAWWQALSGFLDALAVRG
ncbi:MAG: 3-oxoadipate enol-lactonase [Acidimicrobiaceae bacterium]|nr:3-oxoadipate enol-lactonase [Acidimicrobiaceae bacterium]